MEVCPLSSHIPYSYTRHFSSTVFHEKLLVLPIHIFFRYYNILSSSEKFSKDLLKCFDNNLMKSNPNKWRLVLSSCEKIKMEIGDFEIESSTCEKPTREAILTIYQSYAKRSVKT